MVCVHVCINARAYVCVYIHKGEHVEARERYLASYLPSST